MAGLVRNVTDSVGRSGMNLSPRLSRPWTTSLFTQYTKTRCAALRRYPVLRKSENRLPVYSYFATAFIIMPVEMMWQQAEKQDRTHFLIGIRECEGRDNKMAIGYLFQAKYGEIATCFIRSSSSQGEFQTFRH